VNGQTSYKLAEDAGVSQNVERASAVRPAGQRHPARQAGAADVEGEGEVRRVCRRDATGSMLGLRSSVLPGPCTEGLRIDEAMHPLTIMAVGLYGEVLPNQDGAPIRLVVPWKYGLKSARSIVRIRLVGRQPLTTWERSVPRRVQSSGGVCSARFQSARMSQVRARKGPDATPSAIEHARLCSKKLGLAFLA
jgi:DMSO/TMAO reductase YedYZ molybdopterin-dependent catalytic subunit